MASDAATHEHFCRDRLTWLGYLIVGVTAYTMACFGPLMPFLRSELHMDYTVASYHFSAYAAGILIGGSIGDRVEALLGRRAMIWVFVAGVFAGVAILLGAHLVWCTIFSALLCGLSANLTGQSIIGTISDRFGPERTVALTEINIVASIFSAVAPILIGVCYKSGLGWRGALALPLVAFVAVALIFASTRVPPPLRLKKDDADEAQNNTVSLPFAFWGYWAVMGLMVACEWSMIFWSSDFIYHVSKHAMSKADSAQSVTAFLAAMLTGRVVGSRLVARFHIDKMLVVQGFIAIGGFLVFWLSPVVWLNIFGMFLTGLGISNFYPLTQSAAFGAAGTQSSLAAARLSLSVGTAILCAPLFLGMAADRYGIIVAYGIVLVLLIVATVTVLISNALVGKRAAANAAPIMPAVELTEAS